jgi:3-phytase
MAPKGALLVFTLEGKTRQSITNLDRPNNVDVEYGLPLKGHPTDIAVTTERLKNQLRIFKVAKEGLTEITALSKTKVFTSRAGEQAAPMGIALYRRPKDGAIFAILAPKEGPREGYLAQYRLEDDGQGQVQATFVRFFGAFSGTGEIEAVAVDDELGFVYYADEGNGIHKYHADPDHPEAASELAWFGRTGFKADREGIAIYARPDGTGYIICTDQIEGGSDYHVYPRERTQTDPPLRILRGGADSTDGLDATARPLGPNYPQGLMVAMNSAPKNFLLYRFPLW